MSETRIGRLVDRLPVKFHWTIHNVVAHPIHEVLHLIGLHALADRIHDATLPTHGERVDMNSIYRLLDVIREIFAHPQFDRRSATSTVTWLQNVHQQLPDMSNVQAAEFLDGDVLRDIRQQLGISPAPEGTTPADSTTETPK